jgi:nucleoside phosphorylase
MLLTGVGPLRAARSLAQRLARGVLPDLVVSSGFAGALSPELALSSWVAGARVSEWNGHARVPVEAVALVCAPGLVRCDVLSSSTLISANDALDDAVPDPGSGVVVDMESAALAREAGRRGVPFAIVRLISDTPAHPLPSFVSPFAAALSAPTTASRVASAGRGLCAAVADPFAVVRLVRDSARWLRDLEDGWKRLGPWPV